MHVIAACTLRGHSVVKADYRGIWASLPPAGRNPGIKSPEHGCLPRTTQSSLDSFFPLIGGIIVDLGLSTTTRISELVLLMKRYSLAVCVRGVGTTLQTPIKKTLISPKSAPFTTFSGLLPALYSPFTFAQVAILHTI